MLAAVYVRSFFSQFCLVFYFFFARLELGGVTSNFSAAFVFRSLVSSTLLLADIQQIKKYMKKKKLWITQSSALAEISFINEYIESYLIV